MVICFNALHFSGISDRGSSHYAAVKHSSWKWTNQIMWWLLCQGGSCHTTPLICLPRMVTALWFCYCNSWRTSYFVHVEQIYFSSISFCKFRGACWMSVKDGLFLHFLPSFSIKHFSSKASSDCDKYILSNYVIVICHLLRPHSPVSENTNVNL